MINNNVSIFVRKFLLSEQPKEPACLYLLNCVLLYPFCRQGKLHMQHLLECFLLAELVVEQFPYQHMHLWTPSKNPVALAVVHL